MATLKLTTIGTSTGVVIPKEMLKRLKVGRGDTLFAIETPSGYLLTPYDPEIEEELQIGRRFMQKYRETFKALAK
ncbi:MAG TPA: AbrB/MazE/SpoVT family DNA-binding domain-containing protein [Candidatus Angelobacter sp.]|nr:AbrB/MazE/SpoVT family DNA-binding domain-containing protein [Candidatus Angelobacter sp.]